MMLAGDLPDLQVSCAAAPIHAICDVATIEHLSKHVAQVVPWDVFVGFQVIDQHVPARYEVTHVERVVPAETQTTAAACKRRVNPNR